MTIIWNDSEMRFAFPSIITVLVVGAIATLSGTFVSTPIPFVRANPASVAYATVSVQQTSLQLPQVGQLYIYGFSTGGGSPSSSFVYGQYASVVNVDGMVPAAIAVTNSSVNSFNTNAAYYDIGGAAVSGFSSYVPSYGSNGASGAPSASDTFTVNTQGSLVVVFAIAGGEQCISISGVSGLIIDATNTNNPDLVPAIEIGHAYPNLRTYTVTEQTQQCAAGQDPNHAGDLIGVFVFSPSAWSTTTGPATSTSSIAKTQSSYSTSIATTQSVIQPSITQARTVTLQPSTETQVVPSLIIVPIPSPDLATGLQVLLAVGTVVSVSLGWFFRTRKKSLFHRYLRIIESTYSQYRVDQIECRSRLEELKGKIVQLLNKGKFDESQFAILEHEIKEHLEHLKELG